MDPFSHHVPDSTATIVFRNYTIAISLNACIRCTEEALGDILAHDDEMYQRIETTREYAWGTAELMIVPQITMRWVDWFNAIKSIREWLKMYDSVDMDFDVMIDMVGTVGTGRLASTVFY